MKSKCLCLILFADLALGDCHLIPIDDVSSRKDGHDWVRTFCHWQSFMSRVMRKPAFCVCKNKGADQLRGTHAAYRTADQHICFCLIDCTIPLLPKSEISSL